MTGKYIQASRHTKSCASCVLWNPRIQKCRSDKPDAGWTLDPELMCKYWQGLHVVKPKGQANE